MALEFFESVGGDSRFKSVRCKYLLIYLKKKNESHHFAIITHEKNTLSETENQSEFT